MGDLSGNEAFTKKKAYAGKEDFTYAKHKNNWMGMYAVLKAKFARGTEMWRALEATGDTYLLEHNSHNGRDVQWSDNSDGTGTNWLGLQLMLIRDEFSGKSGWTDWARRLLDFEEGKPRDEEGKKTW